MVKKTEPTHLLPTRDPPQKKRTIQTESKGLEKKYSKQMDRKKKIWGSNTQIRENRLQKRGHRKRPRRTLHNTQGKGLSRRHKYSKHICTQHRSTQIYKENPGGLQERY